MVKRRVKTGLDTDAIAQLDLGVDQPSAPEMDIDQLGVAGGNLALDEGSGNTEEMMQHYFDIGQLMSSGGDV
ncbi:MAG: hypothetical protein DRN30_04395, partial [Thermoplasmata archaeon]